MLVETVEGMGSRVWSHRSDPYRIHSRPQTPHNNPSTQNTQVEPALNIFLCVSCFTVRYRAKMAHTRQSRPSAGLGFQVKVLKPFQGVLLRSEAAECFFARKQQSAHMPCCINHLSIRFKEWGPEFEVPGRTRFASSRDPKPQSSQPPPSGRPTGHSK